MLKIIKRYYKTIPPIRSPVKIFALPPCLADALRGDAALAASASRDCDTDLAC